MTIFFVIAGPDPQSMLRVAQSEGMDPGSSPGGQFLFVIAGPDPQSMLRVAQSEGMDPGSSPG